MVQCSSICDINIYSEIFFGGVLMADSYKVQAEGKPGKLTIIDGHFDLLSMVEPRRSQGYNKVIENNFLPVFKEGRVDVVVSSIYIENKFLPEMGLRKALDQISALYSEIDESPDKIMLCRTYDDIITAKEKGMLGIMLSFEGVDPISNDLSLLRVFYELGVRMVGLVWSRRNYAGDGSHYYNKVEGTKGGLTEFGVKVIEMAEDLGMLIDVSHLNDEGFWDVMKFAKKPVIASHSNCRAVTEAMRNLTDEQIKELASRGGVIGMNVCSAFVSDTNESATAERLADHVDHIVNLVGVSHVGFGFDFCDILRATSPEDSIPLPRKNFDVIKGHGGIGNFIEILSKRGYNSKDITLIAGGNFLNLYKKLIVK